MANRLSDWEKLLQYANEDLEKHGYLLLISEDEGCYSCIIWHNGKQIAVYAENYFEDELPGFKPGKIKFIGSLHEIAEAQIGGDIPDDGNIRCLDKDEIELDAFVKLLNGLPKKSRKKATKAFKKFQRKDDYAYVIDKVLFPMVQLWRIKKGWSEGSMMFKEKCDMLTGTDADYMKAVNSDDPVVVTTAHTLTITKGKPGFVVASAILKAQFAEAGKEIPEELINYFSP